MGGNVSSHDLELPVLRATGGPAIIAEEGMEKRFWKIQANLLAFVAGVGAMGIQMHVAERRRLWPLMGAGSVREKVLLLMGAPEEQGYRRPRSLAGGMAATEDPYARR